MFEAKYNKYITKSHSRFAEVPELTGSLAVTPDEEGGYHAGTPILYQNGCLFVDESDAHTIGVGPTGCKKTRTLVVPTVESIIAAGESAIVNDPKMEIYRMTSGFAAAKNYSIKILNLRRPSESHGWNPLAQAYRYYRDGNFDAAYQSVNDFVENVIGPSLAKTVDRYWGDTSFVFLVSLILILMDSVPFEYFNIANLIQLCFEKNKDQLKEMLQDMDPSTPAAYGLHTVLDLDADRTKSCIYSTMLSAMSPFSRNQSLLNMLCKDEIDFKSTVQKPTLIYVVYPDERASLNFLVNCFFTQCYETLVTLSSHLENDRLPIRFNFVIDEFSNLPMIENFDNRISEARSKNIRYFLFCQSFSQLQNKYAEHAETIISNCSNWVIFSSREIGFLSKISEICGREIDYNGIEHFLISPAEMQHLKKYRDGAEALIIRAGEYPYVSLLPDYDRIAIFPQLPAFSMAFQSVSRRFPVMSFEEWCFNISCGKDGFSMPFPLETDEPEDRSSDEECRSSDEQQYDSDAVEFSPDLDELLRKILESEDDDES